MRALEISESKSLCVCVDQFHFSSMHPVVIGAKFFKNFLSYIFRETLKAGAKFEELFRIPFLMGNRLTRGT